MTVDQVALYFSKIHKDKLTWAEIQAGIIWSMASGKYKSNRNARELKLEDLKKMGILKDSI